MKNLAQQFLTEEEQKQVIKSVQAVEKITSGEIVPMVVSSSYHYPLATMIGSLAVSLILATGFTVAVSILRMWESLRTFDLWIFPAVFGAGFLITHELLKRLPLLKRPFITKREMEEEVEEAALTSFFRKGLNNTRDQTGILIFISVYERRAWILADRGINEKVPPESWKEIVDVVVTGIRQNRQAAALCEAIGRCGKTLKTHFPIKADDTDELDNLIIDK